MKRVIKVVAIVCIFSTLFMGCYSSTLIDPRGEERNRIYEGEIRSVVTKEGAKYEFEIPPTIANDAIVGVIRTLPGPTAHQVSIPISEVAEVSVSEFSTEQTVRAGVLVLAIAGTILFLTNPPKIRVK